MSLLLGLLRYFATNISFTPFRLLQDSLRILVLQFHQFEHNHLQCQQEICISILEQRQCISAMVKNLFSQLHRTLFGSIHHDCLAYLQFEGTIAFAFETFNEIECLCILDFQQTSQQTIVDVLFHNLNQSPFFYSFVYQSCQLLVMPLNYFHHVFFFPVIHHFFFHELSFQQVVVL